MDDFHSKHKKTKDTQKKEIDQEPPQQQPMHTRDALVTWKAREHESIPKSQRWYMITGTILVLIVAYAIITNSPIMAITFILIGVVGYLLLNRESPEVQFRVSAEGVHTGKEYYPYENIQSFWIFYEPPERKIISLHTTGEIMPFVHIPLGDEDPMEIRDILLKFVPEKKHPQRFVDILEKFF